ncbi:Agd3-related carbohydrate deacetylase [Nonomuraea sp. LPB2021202275-12-8]|uniref:Agd3-related carbohydrate deacetylase n=1 Tax=Nonomuraea sp. LPB2021202275-12-8 TaxID=3120159 RepID=UPI00300C243A
MKAKGVLPVNRSARAATSASALAAAASDRVGLRALVVAVDPADWGVATWKSVLDRVGAPYDVVYSRTQPLAAADLLQADGTGRYNAILLTNNSLLYFDGSGYVSGFDAAEWNVLWAYERDYSVRQASLYTAYGTWPEDYCLRAGSEGGVGGTPISTDLTTAGASVFDYLKTGVDIPISLSYVYRSTIAGGCPADPIITDGGDVLGVRSTSTDGRERMALTFTSNQYLPQADLLTYGVFRWASKGLHLGERRHYLNADVDDWFSHTDHLYANGTLEQDPGYRMSRADAVSTYGQQNSFRAANPLAANFKLNVAYNGEGSDPSAPSMCLLTLPGTDGLTSYSRCRASSFTWINHTFTHPKMNVLDYATSRAEIQDNLTRAAALGLQVDPTVLKTGEYSGLGVYHPDPNNDIDPPTDHGLAASNPDLLQAADDLGVKYLHGNMSFASHRPSCFNCGIYHPLRPSLMVVPDWPTNIAYHTTTPDEETLFYNSYYGPSGSFPYWPVNQTYAQVLGHESDVAMQHVMSGSVYSHTFHQGNLRNYGGNQSLVFDWLDAVLAKYNGYYNVPLITPNWGALAQYVERRTQHFAGLAGVNAVYDRAAGTITFTAAANASVFATNAALPGATPYGTDTSAHVALTAGVPVTVPASVRP